jgi:hypothetical protein
MIGKAPNDKCLREATRVGRRQGKWLRLRLASMNNSGLSVWSLAHFFLTACVLCFVVFDAADRRDESKANAGRHAELCHRLDTTEHLMHHQLLRLDMLQHAKAGEKLPLPPPPK